MHTMNIFPHIQKLRAYSSEPEHARVLFALYWQMVLVGAFVLVAGVFVYGGWQIFSIMSGTTSSGSDTSSGSTKNAPLDVAQVDAVLQGLVQRQARFEEYKTNPPVVPDPGQ